MISVSRFIGHVGRAYEIEVILGQSRTGECGTLVACDVFISVCFQGSFPATYLSVRILTSDNAGLLKSLDASFIGAVKPELDLLGDTNYVAHCCVGSAATSDIVMCLRIAAGELR